MLMAYRHELERQLIVERVRNNCLRPKFIESETPENLSEECRPATEHVSALPREKIAYTKQHGPCQSPRRL